MNDQIEKRKQAWVDFYDLSSPVNRLFHVEYPMDGIEAPLPWWDKMQEREDWSYAYYMRQLENMDKLHDDRVPYMPIQTGTEIFAEAFGSDVFYPTNSNPVARYLINDVSEFNKIKMPKLEDTKLMLLFDMADRLKARVGDDALFSLPDMQMPVDVAALIWNKTDFYMSMFDEEPAIRELTAMIREFMFTFLDEWFRRYGRSFIGHFPRYYMPYGVTMSIDEIGIVSSEMYNSYFRDEIAAFSNRYGAIGIHCCADSDHQWQNLTEIPNLKLLNFVRTEEATKRAINFFGGHVAQLHETIVDIDDQPDAKKIHLAYYPMVSSFEEALRVADEFNEKKEKMR